MPKIILARHSYTSRSKPLSAQRLINWRGEAAPQDAKNTFYLLPASGLKSFATAGTGPVWGAIEMAEELYIVAGTNVYRVEADGNVSDLGSIGFVGEPVSMAANGTQVCIVKPDGTGWIATSSAVNQITDGDYQLASTVTFIDGYFFFTAKDSGQVFVSELDDGTAYDATKFATIESNPDNNVAAKAFYQNVWIFGKRSTEVYYNAGTAGFPFARVQGATVQRGCAAKLSVAADDTSFLWLGDDRVIYRANGYQPVRVSTHAVEQALAGYLDIEQAFAYIFTENGHKVYSITFPTDRVTWEYDLTTGLWSERQSQDAGGRFRINCLAYVFGKNLVGDYENGNIYELDPETYSENGTTIIRKIVSAPVWIEGNRFTIDRLNVDFEAGVGLTTGQGSDPQAILRVSYDGGLTWGNQRLKSIGKIGEYKDRAVWRKLGQARQMVFEISVSDPVKTVVNGAYISIRAGRV